MASRSEQIVSNVRKLAAAGAPNEDLLKYLAYEGVSGEQFKELLEGPTLFGQAKEFVKGIPAGFVGTLGTAVEGAAALLPEEAEKAVVGRTRKIVEGLTPEAALGYEDTVGRQLGQAVGSIGSFVVPGGLAGKALGAVGMGARAAGTVVGGGLGAAVGAGEARQRAEAEEATPEERAQATLFGVFPGALEALPTARLLRFLEPAEDVIQKLPKGLKSDLVKRGKDVLTTAGIEGLQEFAQGLGQNLIAQGIYKPDQELLEGLSEQAAYGAGAGAIAEVFMNVVLGRKASTTRENLLKQEGEKAAELEGKARSPQDMTYAERSREIATLSAGTPTAEEQARIDELTAFNDAENYYRMRAPETEAKDLEDQIKRQTAIQGEFRETMGEGVGFIPGAEFAGPPTPEAEFPTTLTSNVLDATGLSKQSSFYKQLLDKDLTDPEDQVAIGQVLAKVRANPNIAESTKTGLEQVAMQGFGAAAQQQELFETKGKRKGEPTAGALRTAAVTPAVEPVAEGRLITEEDFKKLGIGPTNKKLREDILGKDLSDPEQAAVVKNALETYASAPNRSPKIASNVESFLGQPEFKGAEDVQPTRPSALVAGAGEPSVSVPSKRRVRAAAGVKSPDTGSMATAGEGVGSADVGAADELSALTNEEQSALQQELQQELYGQPAPEAVEPASDKKVTRKRPVPKADVDEANAYLAQYVEQTGSVEGALKRIAGEFAFEKKVNRLAKASYDALTPEQKAFVDREIQQQRTLNTAGAMYLSRYNEAMRAKREQQAEEKRMEQEALSKQNEDIRKRRAEERKKEEEVQQRVGQQIQDLLSGRKIRYRKAEKGAKSTKAAVDKFVAAFTKNWKNAPSIVVVQSVDGLPAPMQAQLLRDGAGSVPGAFNPSDQTVYLIADNIKSAQDAALTVVHEVIGHYGLQSILGANYRKVMHRLYNTNHQVRAKANMKMAEGMDLSTAVEEVLAEATEARFVRTDTLMQYALHQLKKLIRNFMQMIGVKTLRDKEVTDLLDSFRDYVIEGKGTRGVGKASKDVVYRNDGTPIDAKTLDIGGVQRSLYDSKGRPLAATEEGVRNFWKWFGDSKTVDDQGRPILMFHGTARDINEFIPKQANAIFVTADPNFAESFSRASFDYVRTELRSNMTPEQMNMLRNRVIQIAEQDGVFANLAANPDATGPNTKEDFEKISTIDLFDYLPDQYAQATRELIPVGENIMPLYVRAEKPFDYQNEEHVRPIIQKLIDQGYLDFNSDKSSVFTKHLLKGEISLIRDGIDSLTDIIYGNTMEGNWGVIEQKPFQDAIREAGYDGFYIRESGRKNLGVFKSEQVKSATGNFGSFDASTGNIRYRRKPVLTAAGQQAQATLQAMGNISNTQPKQPQMGTMQKVGAFFFDPSYRQQQIDRLRVTVAFKGASVERKLFDAYNGAIRDSLGNVRPDVFMTSAEHADVMTVEAMKRGRLVLDKNVGWVAKDGPNSLQGVMDKIKDLGIKLGDQDLAFKLANDAFIARRANSLLNDPNSPIPPNLLPSAAQIKAGMDAFKKFPELEAAFKEFTDFKNGMIDAMVEGDRLSAQQAQAWKNVVDYVPWNRIKEYEDLIQNSPQTYSKGLTNLGSMKQLKGGFEPINNIFDNMVGLTFWMGNSAIRNHAAVKLTDAFVTNNLGATKIPSPQAAGVNPNNVVTIYRNGKIEFYEFDSIADVYAFKGVESMGGPLIQAFASLSNVLRKATTATPQFALSQVFQDSYRATTNSGVKNPFSVPSKVLKNFVKELGDDPLTQELKSMGIAGAYDFMPGRAQDAIEKEFGVKQRSILDRVFSFAEAPSIASDAAMRKAVFEQTLAETKSAQFPDGDVLLARYRAQEIINFKRQGRGKLTGTLRQVIPFMNAYIQGMDIFYRSMTGRGIAAEERSMATMLFWKTGIKLAALSSIYAMLVGGDDEYEGLRDYEKDKNFIIPGLPEWAPNKIPVAPEVGFLFKVIPERIYNYVTSQGTASPQDATTLRKALGSAAFDAFASPNMTPQFIKPTLEVMVNYSFFTQSPIVGRGLEKLEPAQQYTDSTSELAKMLGGLMNYSPAKLDYMMRGYTGIAGGTVLDITNTLGANRPDKRLYELPGFKTFMYDRVPGGYKEQYYNFREDIDRVTSTVNTFRARGQIDELVKYLESEKNLMLYSLGAMVSTVDQQFESIRALKKIVSNDPNMSGADKKNVLEDLERTENEILKGLNTPFMRKVSGF
jgi:hypothetical protein